MKRTLSIAAAAALLAGAFGLPAQAADQIQVPRLVKDINPGSTAALPTWQASTDGDRSAVIGGTMLFGASTSQDGNELWATDGTPAGTHLVRDIYSGLAESTPRHLTAYAGKVYFSAEGSDGKGREVWASDGTAAGTARVTDVNDQTGVDTGDSDPRDLVVAGGSLYFTAETSEATRSLYRLTAGSAPVKLTGFAVKDVSAPAAWGDKVVFAGTTTTSGSEPWVTDGTFGGTHQLKDVNPGAGGSVPHQFTSLGNGAVLFAATDPTDGTELWTSNGAVTQQVKDVYPGAESGLPTDLFAVDGTAYFAAKTASTTYTVWVTNGTGAGTQMLAAVRGGGNSGTPTDFTLYNGLVYFGGSELQHGSELWRTDGTPAGTTLVRDTNPGGWNGSPHSLRVVDGVLYFLAENGAQPYHLWRTDGTSAGTAPVPTAVDPSGVELMSTLGRTLFFAGSSAAEGRELWAYTARVDAPTSAPTSAPTPAVSKLATSTTARAKRSYSQAAARNKKITISIRVRASGVIPSGRVVLKKGSKVVGRGALHRGVAKIRITKKLATGTTTIRAYYSGSRAAMPSRSSTVKLRVR